MAIEDSSSNETAAAGFARVVVRAGDVPAAEWIAAEAWAAGAAGVEERDVTGGVELCIYAPVAAMEDVRAAVASTGAAIEFGNVEAVVDVDWAEHWKQGLEAIEVSARLLVRPSFVDHTLRAGQQELVIDPGQAFGTGGHASTRLALEWIDALAGELPSGARLLDVGTGTGVLVLAAIRLANVHALGFDVDPLAITAARANALANAIDCGLDLFVGPLDAIALVEFDLVVANLLKSELLPLAEGIAARTRQGGLAVFSGLLATEAEEAIAKLERVGFEPAGAREATDGNGDRWTALLMRR
jgi:ribosomal protein L11 methyltransferase